MRIAFILLFLLLSSLTTSAQELHRSLPRDLKTLDPHSVQGIVEGTVQRDLFEGLMVEDAAGNYIPGAAKDVQISSDGLVYTFSLRSSFWTNGDPVTAHDFAYAFQRMVDPKTAAEGAFLLEPIVNATEIMSGKEKNIQALGVRAINETTFEIRLKKPTPYLLGILAQPVAMPVHKPTLEQQGSTWTSVTTIVTNGPYMLADVCPQSYLKLAKNSKYWDADNVKTPTVYYWIHQNPETELDQFRTGKLHTTWTVPFAKLKWVRKTLRDSLRITPFLALTYYAINMNHPTLGKSLQLRQALNLAINRSALVEKVRTLGETPAYSWVPPQVANYKPISVEWQNLSQAEREQKARKLYEEAGFGSHNPLDIELLCDTDENNRRIATAVAAMWQHVLGVKVRVRIEGAKLFFTSRNQRDFDLLQGHWIGDFNDPETFLSLFRSDIGAQNVTGFHDTKFMETLKKAIYTADKNQRQELMQQAEQIILDQMPVVTLFFDTQFQLVSPRLRGWEDNILGNHRSKYLYLSDEKCA